MSIYQYLVYPRFKEKDYKALSCPTKEKIAGKS